MLARTMLTNDAFARMTREMDRIFETLAPRAGVTQAPQANKGWGAPPLNVWSDENALHAEAELPGVAMENIEVFTTADSLTIRGSREAIRRDESERVIRTERAAGAFERSVSLPFEIDPERVSATLRDGVLTVTMPRAQAVLPRRVSVNAG